MKYMRLGAKEIKDAVMESDFLFGLAVMGVVLSIIVTAILLIAGLMTTFITTSNHTGSFIDALPIFAGWFITVPLFLQCIGYIGEHEG